MTATPEDEHAAVEISVNGNALENGGSAAWNEGDNTVLVAVTSADNSAFEEYTVAVTKE